MADAAWGVFRKKGDIEKREYVWMRSYRRLPFDFDIGSRRMKDLRDLIFALHGMKDLYRDVVRGAARDAACINCAISADAQHLLPIHDKTATLGGAAVGATSDKVFRFKWEQMQFQEARRFI